MKRRFLRFALAGTFLFGLLYIPNGAVWLLSSGESRCTGSASSGTLESAVQLTGGSTAASYCWICSRALRTYGHHKAVKAAEDAYQTVGSTFPGTKWIFGEAAWPWGGPLWPHRTHQTGLSFDFMSPLKEEKVMPSHPFNRFGYDERFDRNGRGSAGQIDFDALAAHLVALKNEAAKGGFGIRKVILAPDLQDDLFAASSGSEVRATINFNRTPVWVRHDNHYHVDFDIRCG